MTTKLPAISFFILLVFSSEIASSETSPSVESLCGPVPALSGNKELVESVKGNLDGKADFLSKMVGKAQLYGEIETTRNQIFQDSDKYFAAQKEAYLAHMFCVFVSQDKTLPTEQKLKALSDFKNQIQKPQIVDEKKIRLIEKYKEILNSINSSIQTKDLLVLPALNAFIAHPNHPNWEAVSWAVHKLRVSVESGISLAMEYDSRFFEKSGSLFAFVDFIDANNEIDRRKFGGAVDIWAAHQPTLIAMDVSRMPSVHQAIAWRDELRSKSAALDQELSYLVDAIK